MRQQAGVLLTSLIIFLLALVFVERSFSPTFQQCVGASGSTDKADATKEKNTASTSVVYKYVGCTGVFLDESEGTVTAIATIIIAAFTCTLWLATSKQGELTREALIADKRAFVFPIGFKQLYDKDEKTGLYGWRFRPTWRNSGDTPTRNMRLHAMCELRNSELPDDFNFDYPTTIVGPGLLGPKYESGGGLAPFPPAAQISAQDIYDVQQGKKFMYLMGWVRYFDVFPDTPEHITRFCWAILPEGDPFKFAPKDSDHTLTFSYAHTRRGNSADDEEQT
jgi:hypothetical protein